MAMLFIEADTLWNGILKAPRAAEGGRYIVGFVDGPVERLFSHRLKRLHRESWIAGWPFQIRALFCGRAFGI